MTGDNVSNWQRIMGMLAVEEDVCTVLLFCIRQISFPGMGTLSLSKCYLTEHSKLIKIEMKLVKMKLIKKKKNLFVAIIYN